MSDKNITDRAIETAPIKLTADETRAIMKAANASHPIQDYRCCSLVDLGIMKVVMIEPKDHTQARVKCWHEIRKGAQAEDMPRIERAQRDLNEFARQTAKKEKGHVLTPLGKQVARGVSVKLNGQYKTVPC